jgi:hypothetical protein
VGCLPDPREKWMEKISEDDRKMNYDLMKVAREQGKMKLQETLDRFWSDEE